MPHPYYLIEEEWKCNYLTGPMSLWLSSLLFIMLVPWIQSFSHGLGLWTAFPSSFLRLQYSYLLIEAGVDHEEFHGGAYGRAAGGDLQVPPHKPHPLAATTFQSTEAAAARAKRGGGGVSSWLGEDERASCYGPTPRPNKLGRIPFSVSRTCHRCHPHAPSRTRAHMAATSPAPMRAAAALTLAPSSLRLGHVSTMPSGRLRRCRGAPRWRVPQCRGKPAVSGVVEDEEEDASREAKPEGKEDESAGALGWFRLDGVGMDILGIAAPAVLALAADPITALVDTAFVGHIGSVELAAVGVSISVFNLVSKLFNVPLLNVTTSFVAEQQAMDDN